MRRRLRRGRKAVYIVTTGPDFTPQRPWDVPPSFCSGVLYVKNLDLREALGFARSFNKRAVEQREAGRWDRRWAILSRHLKARTCALPAWHTRQPRRAEP